MRSLLARRGGLGGRRVAHHGRPGWEALAGGVDEGGVAPPGRGLAALLAPPGRERCGGAGLGAALGAAEGVCRW